MFSFRSTIMAGAAMLVAATSLASAADLGGYNGSMKDGQAYMPAIQSNPSWYLRLDGAYSRHDDPAMTADGINDLTNTSFGNAWSVGGGVGRYIGKNARIELTYDHRFEADIKCAYQNGCCTVDGRVGLTSGLLLTSIYYDFDATRGFRPYIGIGLGAVNHRTKAGTADITCCPCGTTATIEKNSDWSVAGALMAGFSYQLRDRLHLDAGYRFLYLGGIATGNVVDPTGPTVISSRIDVNELHAHELRFGLRYDVW